jgi:hypothetical protein
MAGTSPAMTATDAHYEPDTEERSVSKGEASPESTGSSFETALRASSG